MNRTTSHGVTRPDNTTKCFKCGEIGHYSNGNKFDLILKFPEPNSDEQLVLVGRLRERKCEVRVARLQGTSVLNAANRDIGQQVFLLFLLYTRVNKVKRLPGCTI